MPHVKADAVLNQDPAFGEILYDITFDANGDIASEDQLETAILVSLFTDQRALPHEAAKAQTRRGWIGDLETPADPIGSKLWLLEQSRLTGAVVAAAGSTAQASLQWMVRDEIAVSVNARAYVGRSRLNLNVDIKKPNSPAEVRAFDLWANTGRG